MININKISKWIVSNIIVMVLIAINVALLIIMIKGNATYKEIIKQKNIQFELAQDTIKIKERENIILSDSLVLWTNKYGSYDKQIIQSKIIRNDKKKKSIHTLAVVDSLSDAGIDEYYRTGKIQN